MSDKFETAEEIQDSATFDEVYPYLEKELIHNLGNLMLSCLEEWKYQCKTLSTYEERYFSDCLSTEDLDKQESLVKNQESHLTEIMAETSEKGQMKSVCLFLWSYDKEPLEPTIEAWAKEQEGMQ